MLILTRHPGETIIMETRAGERVEVVVLGVKGNQVRIGTAARSVAKVARPKPALPSPVAYPGTGRSSEIRSEPEVR